jgi:hypothetical protein
MAIVSKRLSNSLTSDKKSIRGVLLGKNLHSWGIVLNSSPLPIVDQWYKELVLLNTLGVIMYSGLIGANLLVPTAQVFEGTMLLSGSAVITPFLRCIRYLNHIKPTLPLFNLPLRPVNGMIVI